jgi:Pyruvate/2-oxoacid:ferredoxin oxidoreductase delta subunit
MLGEDGSVWDISGSHFLNNNTISGQINFCSPIGHIFAVNYSYQENRVRGGSGMRKAIILLAAFLFVFLSFAKSVLACEIKLTPSTFTVKAGDTVSFTLERYQTHRRCDVPLEDTSIKITGGEIVDPGVWQRGYPDLLTFTVRFTTPGEAVVHVERYCEKEGLMVTEAKGTVLAAQDSSSGEGETVPVPQVTEPENPPDTRELSGEQATEEAGQENHNYGSTSTSPDESSDATLNDPLTNGGTPETLPSCEAGQNAAADQSWLEKLSATPLHYWLWYGFIFTGLILYLLRLEALRKPFLILSLIVLGFYLGGCPCAVGVVFKILIGGGIALFLIPVAISVIWGRVFCGWTCPLGAVQEFVHAGKLGVRVPDRMDKYLKYLKFVILGVFGYLTITTGNYIWGDYEPFKVLFNFQGTATATAILLITLLVSLFIERPFCRYACPLGAVFVLTSRSVLRKVGPDAQKCTGCKLCTRGSCAMNAIRYVDSATGLPVVDNGECITCLRCGDVCPKRALPGAQLRA